MRRSGTRKKAQSDSTAPITSGKKEMERTDKLFYSYANRSSGLIEKMKAEKQGYFTLEEWPRGLKSLRVDTTSKLKKALPDLEKEVNRPTNFVDFYSYGFRYCLTEEKQKSIDIESICQSLDLILGPQFRTQVDYVIKYLKVQSDYKVRNMDQWIEFYRFCTDISFLDLSNYDPELAWPLVLDNFVEEWLRETRT